MRSELQLKHTLTIKCEVQWWYGWEISVFISEVSGFAPSTEMGTLTKPITSNDMHLHDLLVMQLDIYSSQIRVKDMHHLQVESYKA